MVRAVACGDAGTFPPASSRWAVRLTTWSTAPSAVFRRSAHGVPVSREPSNRNQRFSSSFEERCSCAGDLFSPFTGRYPRNQNGGRTVLEIPVPLDEIWSPAPSTDTEPILVGRAARGTSAEVPVGGNMSFWRPPGVLRLIAGPGRCGCGSAGRRWRSRLPSSWVGRFHSRPW